MAGKNATKKRCDVASQSPVDIADLIGPLPAGFAEFHPQVKRLIES